MDQQGTPITPKNQNSKGMAITALVCGIVGLILYWFPFVPYPLAILAIVFGFIGLKQSKGMALTGIITGFLTFILKIWFWIDFVTYFS
ncbi:DUF4190 domain-containing protein [Salinibacillus xinjiangensis]|uniref:DUF4190 domain-containing protein n=1 Tax=Salinibacillus xinjiangensis TaxID=1229268 RepID=A0A6G1X4C3_9BACI|nr:DUF4190 domain-containing protein [Salinibacillus xinjiangensis]MRG85841.1 DUF4190 domain-containing protein [Salinibacillus xinjiangensis]